MTKHAFPTYAFCNQTRYLCRHLIKSKGMKLLSFITWLQKIYTYLGEVPPDTEGQEIASLPADKIMDIIHHSMPTTQKNKMIEEGPK